MTENETPEYEKQYTLSSPDKLDWPERIEQRLYWCTCARGHLEIFKSAVVKLEMCVKENFYGLDFYTPIENNRLELIKIKSEQEKLFISLLKDGIYYHPKKFEDLIFRDKEKINDWMIDWEYNKRFEFVRGLLARHRGLIWGRRKVPTGFLGEAEDVAGDQMHP